MDAVYIYSVPVLVVVLSAIYARLKARKETTCAPVDWQLREYLSGGEWRDYYDVFAGVNLDEHERNHLEGVQLARGVELAQARQTGRHEGRQVVIQWKPGRDAESDAAGAWLERHGSSSGVKVVRRS